MKEFILHNKQTLGLFTAAYAIAFVSPTLSFLIILFLLYRFKVQSDYKSILMGFILVILMSDSRQTAFSNATSLKIIYVVTMIIFMLLDKKKFKPYSTFYKPFLLFSVFSFFLVFRSPEIFNSIQKTISYAFIFFIIPNYFKVCYDDEGDFFIKDLFYFMSFIILIGIILIPFINKNILYIEGRFNGLLGNPNGLGLYSSIFFILFSIYNNLFPGNFSKKEKSLIYLLIVISILLSGSRNSIITIIIFSISALIFRYSTLLGFTLIILIIVSNDLISNFIYSLIETLGLTEYFRLDEAEKVSGRVIAWEFAWQNIQDNYFFGKGFDYTNYLYIKFYEVLSMKGHLGNAHNSYLTIWLDTGLIGLLLLLRALIISYAKVAKASPMIIPALISFLFSMFFESWFAASLNPFTFQLIIIVILAEIKLNNTNTQQNLSTI